jgi:hypothetical protein
MKLIRLALLLVLLYSSTAYAQDTPIEETTQDKIDTLYNRTEYLLQDLSVARKFKWNAYVQSQFQLGDTAGINPWGGGSFAPDQNNRFSVRRGRIKASYEDLDEFGSIKTQIVMQLDFTERGFLMRDFYGKVTDPWTRTFGLKAGIMDKPFGYEVTYSSGLRETPERGRMSQSLFPGEKDAGVQFVIQPPKNSRYNFFKLETGLYNGNGYNTSNSLGVAGDYDSQKDWISRLSFFKTNFEETFKISGGVSSYIGGHKYNTWVKSDLGTLANGNKSFIMVDSSLATNNSIAKSRYYGADVQFSKDWNIGITTLRAEYIYGTQPGTTNDNKTPVVLPSALINSKANNTLIRQFNGAYFYLLQNIARSKHNVLLKYDWYDPNKQVAGTQIGASGSNLNANDVKYSTFGIGYLFAYNANWKFLIYKDFVTNEKTNLAGYLNDRKDNVLTLRIQLALKDY